MSLDDCFAFYRQHYAPNNALVVVVGDVDTEEVLRTVHARYGHLAAQPREEPATRPEPEQAGERRLELSLPLASPRVVCAWKAPAAGTPEHAALDVASELLVGGDSSRLHRLLVEDTELATDVSGWVAGWTHPGLIELSMTLRPDVDPAVAEAALDKALAEMVAGPIGLAELEKAKNGLEASFLRGQADVGSRARAIGHGWATLGDWEDLWRSYERLQAVTAEDVLQAAREVLRSDRRTTAIARPSGEAPPDAADGLEGEDDAGHHHADEGGA